MDPSVVSASKLGTVSPSLTDMFSRFFLQGLVTLNVALNEMGEGSACETSVYENRL